MLDTINMQSGDQLSKLMKVWENKNAQRAVRGAGLSTVAVSLAACGGSSTTSSSTSSSETTTTVTPISQALTIRSDDVVTGTTAADTISGARIDTVLTLNAGDSITDATDGDGDTLTATLNGGLSGATITGIENIDITNLAAGEIVFSTSSLTSISGVDSVTVRQAGGDVTLTRLVDLAELTFDTIVDDITVTFADSLLTGSSDSLTINLSGVVLTGGEDLSIGAASDTDGDIEALTFHAYGADSDLDNLSSEFADVTSVTVTGTAALDFGSVAAFPKLTSFDGTGGSNDVTLLLGADGNTATDDAKTLSFGSGDDTLDVGALAPSEMGTLTIDMGSGDDSLDIDDFADTAMVLRGGLGDDSLETAEVISSANGVNISGFEKFILGKNSGNQDMSDLSLANNAFDTVQAAAATTTFDNLPSTVTTLELKGGVATTAATFTYRVDGSADSATIKAVTANTTITGQLSIDELETATFDSSSYDLKIDDDIVSADLVTVYMTGDNIIELGSAGTNEFTSTKLATIDATGLTGTAASEVFAINSTVDMTVTAGASTGAFTVHTGSGGDTITAGSGSLVAVGGAGDDTITGGVKADTITGGADNDTINITDTTSVEDLLIYAEYGVSNYDIVTGFETGTASTDDELQMTATNFGWNSTGGANAAVLDTGATLKAAVTASSATDTTIFTISTNMADNSIDNFLAGTQTYADLKAAAITALGATGTGIDNQHVSAVFVDDGEHTALWRFASADGTDNAVAASEIELIAIFKDIDDATDFTASNFDSFAT